MLQCYSKPASSLTFRCHLLTNVCCFSKLYYLKTYKHDICTSVVSCPILILLRLRNVLFRYMRNNFVSIGIISTICLALRDDRKEMFAQLDHIFVIFSAVFYSIYQNRHIWIFELILTWLNCQFMYLIYVAGLCIRRHWREKHTSVGNHSLYGICEIHIIQPKWGTEEAKPTWNVSVYSKRCHISLQEINT